MFYEFEHFGSSEYFYMDFGTALDFPVHLHRSFELIHVLSGKMTVTVDDNVYSLGEGEAVLIFPNQRHSIVGTEEKHILLIFSPDIVSAFSRRCVGKIPTSSAFKIGRHLLDGLVSLSPDSSVIKRKAVLYSICALFDERAVYLDRASGEWELLYRIFDFVEHSYGGSCTLEALSHAIAYGYSYLSRYFKSAVGISFNSYVNRYRVSRACYLLANTDLSILACSLDCGYTSLRSFNRNFLLLTGKTPTAYRTAAKGSDKP